MTARDGTHITPGLSAVGVAGLVQDANGNQVSTDGAGHFTDTLGQTALAITGSGTPASPFDYTYTDTSGTAWAVVVSYVAYTVKTNFGCTGIAEYGPQTINLVDRITYPDGTYYQYTYEPTPGYSGDVTGRLAQITLPTGGTIAYTYFNGSNGIVCSDGSTAAMHRTTTDGDTVYSRVQTSGTAWTTAITPPDNNEVYLNFQTHNTNFYETSRTNYAGTHAGGVVATSTATCYNGNTCGAVITGNITSAAVFTTVSNGFESSTNTAYNSNGLVTDVYEYDFGSSVGNVGALLRHTATTYNTTLTNGIIDHPSSVTVYDGSGAQVALTTFAYDETTPTATSGVPMHATVTGSRGNPTSVSVWRNLPSSTYLTTTNTYYDTGMLKTSQDPGLHTTTFDYSSTFGYSYLTQITLPNTGVAHVSKINYDANTGLVIATCGENFPSASACTQISSSLQPDQVTHYYDFMLRPAATYYADGGSMGFAYAGAYEIEQTHQIDSTHSTNSFLLLDGYGRTSRTAVANGESTPYDQQDTCYDNMGRVNFVSYPYQGPGFSATKVCSGSGDAYAYSFAGSPSNIARVTTTHSDSTTSYHDVYGRSTLDTDEGTGSGTTRVQRMSQVDGLGRTTSVCEVSTTTQQGSETTPSSCGLDMPGGYTGFSSAYTYDTLNNLTSVAQGTIAPHARAYAYDSLSRLQSVTDPEMQVCTTTCTSGTTSYSYDNDGNLTSRTRPAPNQTGTATVTTTYAYDALHRLTQRSYNDGATPASNYSYDETLPWGVNAYNTVGRLTTMSNSNGGAVFSYDSMGRVGATYQATPSVYHVSSFYMAFTYDYLGNLKTSVNPWSLTYTNDYNQAGRLTSITSSWNDSYHPASMFNTAHYNAFGEPLSYSTGDGLQTVATYDTRGRMTNKQALNSGVDRFDQTLPSYAPNGNLVGITDNGVARSFTFDDMNRLSQSTAGGPATGYGYDRFGNRTQNGTASLPVDATNRVATGNGVVQDAVGNIISDSTSGSTYTYTYDAENRIVSVGGGTSATYAYDPAGHRINKTVGSSGIDYLYDLNGNPISEVNTSNGGLNREEVFTPGGGHLATYVAGETFFAYTNWLGTERMRTNESGTVEQYCDWTISGEYVTCGSYFPYQTPTGLSTRNFAGYEHDTETNLEHTQFRYYNAHIGRWMSADPYMGSMDIGDPQSMNRYAYVTDDPINSTDELGLFQTIQIVPKNPSSSEGPPSGYDYCFYSPRAAGCLGGGHIYICPRCRFSAPPCLAGAGPLLPGQFRCSPSNGPPLPPKSAARQQCEANAKRNKNAAMNQIMSDGTRETAIGFAAATAFSGTAGCMAATGLGAFLGGAATAPVGAEGAVPGGFAACALGFGAAALDSATVNLGGTLLAVEISMGINVRRADNAFNQEMQQCSQIP